MTVVERAHVVLHEPNLAQRRSAQFKGWESGHCHERSPTSRHEAPLAPSFARRRDCGRPTIGTLELVATRQTQSRCLALFHESEVEPHTPGTLSLQSPLRADELVSPRAGILEPIFSAPQTAVPTGLAWYFVGTGRLQRRNLGDLHHFRGAGSTTRRSSPSRCGNRRRPHA